MTAHATAPAMATKKTTRAPTPTAPGDDDDEAAWLARYRLEDYPRPSVAVDVVLLTVEDGALRVGLAARAEHPHRGRAALPGSFVGIKESLDAAARRVLAARAGLEGVFVEQLYTFGDVGRDPRGRVITVAYFGLVHAARFAAVALPLRARVVVPWAGETGGPVEVLGDDGRALTLAFDHDRVVGMAVKRLRGKLDYTPVGFQLLPAEFTLRELQDVHEAVRGEPVNKDSFRRRMLASGHLEATGTLEQGVTWRPAEFYRFIRRSAV
jgi:8-oxo-dGTP diphosphatase